MRSLYKLGLCYKTLGLHFHLLKSVHFGHVHFLALCFSDHTCARESTFFILLCNSNYQAINSFHQRLIFPLTCFMKSRGLLVG